MNILNERFDKIVCVSIPSRKERMEKIFDNWGLQVTFHDAFLKKDLNRDEFVSQGFITPDCSLNDGRICCHYSHCQVYNDFLNDPNVNTILIFEDDLHENVKNIDQIVSNIPDDWDYINFGPCWEKCSKTTKVNKYFVESFKPKCRHAYALNKKATYTILNNTTPMKDKAGDEMIADLIESKKFKSYSTNHMVFGQNRGELGTNLGNYDIQEVCGDTLTVCFVFLLLTLFILLKTI